MLVTLVMILFDINIFLSNCQPWEQKKSFNMDCKKLNKSKDIIRYALRLQFIIHFKIVTNGQMHVLARGNVK